MLTSLAGVAFETVGAGARCVSPVAPEEKKRAKTRVAIVQPNE